MVEGRRRYSRATAKLNDSITTYDIAEALV
jgi:hypothetical protein